MGDTVYAKIRSLAEEANELCLGFRYVFYKIINEVRPGLVLIVVAEVSAVQLHTKHWSGTETWGQRGHEAMHCTSEQHDHLDTLFQTLLEEVIAAWKDTACLCFSQQRHAHKNENTPAPSMQHTFSVSCASV